MASVSAKRHAQAVFEIAIEKKELDKWSADLKTVAGVLGDRKLLDVLENPKVHFSAKQKLINEALPGVGKLARNLVYLLTTKGRLGLASEIAEEYDRLLNAHRGIERAQVVAAVPLTDKQKDQITKYLSSLSGKKVVIDVKTDPGVVGGLVARMGDTLVDGSVKTQLAALKRALTGSAG